MEKHSQCVYSYNQVIKKLIEKNNGGGKMGFPGGEDEVKKI